jgi:aspartate aminotransferase
MEALMRLAKHFENSQVPLLFGFAQEARALIDAGVDVISLEQGQLDFPTPPNVVAAATEFLSAGRVLYTNIDGLPKLKEAICEKLLRDNGLAYKPTEVFVAAGATQIIFNAFAVTLETDDEVIIPAPAWTVFELGVRAHRGRPIYLTSDFASGFKITAAQLDAAITSRTRWLVLNSPGNPSGALYSAEELRKLAEVLRGHPNVCVLSDDLYEQQVFDHRPFLNILNVAPDLRDRVLIANGVSKTYGMTGWRIGYGAGSPRLLEAMKWYQAPSTSSPSHLSQVAAIEALVGSQDYVVERRSTLQHRRNIFADSLNAIDGWSAKRSEGSFYIYACCSRMIGRQIITGETLRTDVDVGRYLLKTANVVAVPGTAFQLSPFIRFSIGASTERLVEAASRIADATHHLREAVA